MWGEHTASRWSQEIASCLLYHIRNCLPPTTKEVILYSDSCGGQNRNIKMTLMLSYIVQKTEIQEIQQKFFLPGHSFSTGDQDFGIIEREKKVSNEKVQIYRWLITKHVTRNPPLIIVIKYCIRVGLIGIYNDATSNIFFDGTMLSTHQCR